MGAVSLKREEPFRHNLKLVDTKEEIVKALIITGIGVYISGRLSDPSLYDKIKNYKDKVINFDETKKKKKISKRNIDKESITFEDWLDKKHSDDELQELFLNMDLAMNYIHDKGYCINSFSPEEIEILNNSLKQVKFDVLLKMPNDTYDKKELVREDIFNSAVLQIGAYMNNISTKGFNDKTLTDFLNNMDLSFLRSDFQSFSPFIPERVFPWYNGVVSRGASVYLHEYDEEKRNRDMKQLEKEFGEEGANTNSNTASQSKGKVMTKSNSAGRLMSDNNDDNNKMIYSQLDNRLDAAFVTALVIPIIMVIFGVILMITSLIMGH